MKYRSVFDIIGPIMLGPSSSHTAGAARIGILARKLFLKEPKRIKVHFYGSFAQTYEGHATDIAVVGGVLNLDVADPALPDSLRLAAARGIDVEIIPEEAIPEHPNTVRIELYRDEDWLSVTGISIGGGQVQITDYSGFPLKLSGENPTMLILHKDAYGAVAKVTQCLMNECINIGHMEVSRLMKGDLALMVIETDEAPTSETVARIQEQSHIQKVVVLEP
ncbi:MAG: L-serine ammonia-lyase, iron-sulfur-dependent, subunit beta [Clostridia bacterium]|nr:L-serine ammonia-lyase, iron-sulfur-dependent, subunit beta [Clostridia bacterium]